MQKPEDRVSFDSMSVGAAEKKRLVHDQFTPIADVAFQPLSLGIAVVYSGRKPQEVPHAADRP